MSPWIRSKLSRRVAGYAGAGLGIAVGVVAAAAGIWVFRQQVPPASESSFWRFLLSDRATLGFLRMAVLMIALYVIASAAALIIGGRWIKSVSTAGFTADDMRSGTTTIAALKEDLATARRERDEALQVLWEVDRG